MLAHRPAEFRAFFAYHDALMEREADSLTQAEGNDRGGGQRRPRLPVLRGRPWRDPAHPRQDAQLADQIAVNYRTAPISERQRTMLDFALHLAAGRGVLDDAWRARLEAQGFSLDDIWDIGAIAGLFGLSNRLVSMARTPPTTSSICWAACPEAPRAEREHRITA